MLIVGLTGGVGSGKTTVSKVFKKEGAYIIEADLIARDLVKPQSEVWKEIVKLFGSNILNIDGSINRVRLADEVFSSSKKRKSLNRILHPHIKEEAYRIIAEIKKSDPEAIVVFDAPLLVETGMHREMDKIIVVTSTKRQQINRVRSRDGRTDEDVRKIISSQMPIQKKLEVADFVIRNEGSIVETRRKAKEIFQELKRIATDGCRGHRRR